MTYEHDESRSPIQEEIELTSEQKFDLYGFDDEDYAAGWGEGITRFDVLGESQVSETYDDLDDYESNQLY